MPDKLPVHQLIEQRLSALQIGRHDLAVRCGYRNTSKGLRRIDALCLGKFDDQTAERVVAVLPRALEVEPRELAIALLASKALMQKRAEAVAAEQKKKWLEAFKPHGWLIGESERPRSTTFYALAGGAGRFLWIDLDLTQPPLTFAQQGLDALRRNPHDPFHGQHTGFWINYTPDAAVRFSIEGVPVERKLRAHNPGRAIWGIKGREMPSVRNLFACLA